MPGRAVLGRAGQGFGSFVETEKFGMKWRCASDDDCTMRRPRPVFNARNRQNSPTRFAEEAFKSVGQASRLSMMRELFFARATEPGWKRWREQKSLARHRQAGTPVPLFFSPPPPGPPST
jgi:hypothetical protein